MMFMRGASLHAGAERSSTHPPGAAQCAVRLVQHTVHSAAGQGFQPRGDLLSFAGAVHMAAWYVCMWREHLASQVLDTHAMRTA